MLRLCTGVSVPWYDWKSILRSVNTLVFDGWTEVCQPPCVQHTVSVDTLRARALSLPLEMIAQLRMAVFEAQAIINLEKRRLASKHAQD